MTIGARYLAGGIAAISAFALIGVATQSYGLEALTAILALVLLGLFAALRFGDRRPFATAMSAVLIVMMLVAYVLARWGLIVVLLGDNGLLPLTQPWTRILRAAVAISLLLAVPTTLGAFVGLAVLRFSQ